MRKLVAAVSFSVLMSGLVCLIQMMSSGSEGALQAAPPPKAKPAPKVQVPKAQGTGKAIPKGAAAHQELASLGRGTQSKPLTVAQLRAASEAGLLDRGHGQLAVVQGVVQSVSVNGTDWQDKRVAFLRFQTPGMRRDGTAPAGPKVTLSKVEDYRDLVPGQEIVVAGQFSGDFEWSSLFNARILSRKPAPAGAPPADMILTDAELAASVAAMKDEAALGDLKVAKDGLSEDEAPELKLSEKTCLDADGNPSAAVLAVLKKIKNIQHLRIDVQVGPQFFEKLAAFPGLRSLAYSPYQFSGFNQSAVDFTALKKWPRLESLQIGGLIIPTDRLLQQIGQLPQLRELKVFPSRDVGDSRITAEGMRGLAESKSLQWIYFLEGLSYERHPIDDEGLAALAKLPRLSLLDVRSNELTGTGIAALAACPELQHVSLTGTAISDAGMQAIAAKKWPELHTLLLMCREVTDAGLEPLFRTGIAWHSFSCTCPLPTDASLIAFGKSGVTEQLVAFELVNCPITDAGLKAFVQKPYPKLETLTICDTKVTDAGIQQLARLQSLKAVTLPEKTVTAAGVAKLKSALPRVNIFQADLYSEE